MLKIELYSDDADGDPPAVRQFGGPVRVGS